MSRPPGRHHARAGSDGARRCVCVLALRRARARVVTAVVFGVAANAAANVKAATQPARAEIAADAASAASERAGDQNDLEILYHADLDGRFAEPACQSGGGSDAGYPRLLDALERVRDRARAENRPPPVTLFGGNVAAPDLLGRGFLQRGREGTMRLASLLATAAYDAVALGHHDLGLEPVQLGLLIDAFAEAGLPVVATNLVCNGARAELCTRIRQHVLIRRGGTLVGVLATISPSVLPGIQATSRSGLSLLDPADAIRSATRRVRAQGATLVVVMTQGTRDSHALEEMVALQRTLARGATATATGPTPTATVNLGRASSAKATRRDVDLPDLILAGGLADDESDRALRLLRADGAPDVVGAPTGTAGVSSVSFSPTGATLAVGAVAMDALPHSLSGGDGAHAGADGADGPAGAARGESPPHARASDVARAALRPEIDAYCSRYAVPVSKGPIRGALSRDEFVAYALEVMRRRAGTEIALLNRAAVKRTPFPLTGTVTLADLQRALPYPAVIGSARLTGGAIESVLGPALGNPKLAAAGLTRTPGGLQVNGRPLDKARTYTVATIPFVAGGGDDILPAGALPWRPVADTPDLRESIAAFLRTNAAAQDGDPGIDLRTDFGPPPASRPLLVGLTDLGLDITDTRVGNRPGYGDAQLARADQQVLKGEATGILQLRQPLHEADARLNLKYGWTRGQPPGAPAVSSETIDLITLAVVYNYRGLRARLAAPRRAVPDPYVRSALESELTRPPLSDTQPRTFHHLELTNTAGALFTLAPPLKVRAGAGVRKELLADGDSEPLGRWRPLLEAGGSLSPIALASVGALAVRLEGLIDYNFVDPTGTREHQLRGSGKLSVPLLPLLFITAGLDLFAVQRQRQGWGASYDTTIGLRVHLDTAHQWL